MVLLPLPAAVSGVGLFMIGLGNGPVFPNMLHLTPRIFGKEISQSVMGVQMSASYVGILLAPALFGLLAQNITAALFPYYLAIWYALMLAGSLFLQKKAKGIAACRERQTVSADTYKVRMGWFCVRPAQSRLILFSRNDRILVDRSVYLYYNK